MGEVYRAHDADLDREIALNLARRRWPTTRNAWRASGGRPGALGALNHPNIAVIHGLAGIQATRRRS